MSISTRSTSTISNLRTPNNLTNSSNLNNVTNVTNLNNPTKKRMLSMNDIKTLPNANVFKIVHTKEVEACKKIVNFLRKCVLFSPLKKYSWYSGFMYNVSPVDIKHAKKKYYRLSKREIFNFYYLSLDLENKEIPFLLSKEDENTPHSLFTMLNYIHKGIITELPIGVTITQKFIKNKHTKQIYIYIIVRITPFNSVFSTEDYTIFNMTISGFHHDYKNMLFNTLFHLYYVSKYYCYESTARTLLPTHQVTSFKMQTRIKETMFNQEIRQKCCVCYESTANITTCNHALCIECITHLQTPACPMCRRHIVYGYDDDSGNIPQEDDDDADNYEDYMNSGFYG
jgi:hypothetical protein